MAADLGQSARPLTANSPSTADFCSDGSSYMAVGQNLRYLFGVGYPPKVVYFKGFWNVHRDTGVLTHSHIFSIQIPLKRAFLPSSSIANSLASWLLHLSQFQLVPRTLATLQFSHEAEICTYADASMILFDDFAFPR